MRAVSRKAARHSVLYDNHQLSTCDTIPILHFRTAMVELIPLREAFAAVGGEGDPVSILSDELLFFHAKGRGRGKRG